MCLVILALGVHPGLPLVLAANRDEFHRRPSASAHAWHDLPGVVGGRDLDQGGSWLAAARRGALAVVTNVRDPARRVTGGPSRGLLVRDFVAPDGLTAEAFVRERTRPEAGYDGFNLIARDGSGTWYGSNRGPGRQLHNGIHALSNHLLDTDWPKVRRTRQRFSAALHGPADHLTDRLLDALHDTTSAPDHELPSTGVPLEWERRLAPPFIVSPEYGTRCSTVVTLDGCGTLTLTERSFDPAGQATGTVRLTLTGFGVPS